MKQPYIILGNLNLSIGTFNFRGDIVSTGDAVCFKEDPQHLPQSRWDDYIVIGLDGKDLLVLQAWGHPNTVPGVLRIFEADTRKFERIFPAEDVFGKMTDSKVFPRQTLSPPYEALLDNGEVMALAAARNFVAAQYKHRPDTLVVAHLEDFQLASDEEEGDWEERSGG